MKVSRGLGLALTAVLLVSGLVAWVVPVPATSEDAVPVQVGTSRPGDHVVYVHTDDEAGAAAPEAFTVLEQTVTLDEDGVPRPVLVVSSARNATDGVVIGGRVGASTSDIGPRAFAQHEFIDLASRDVVRLELVATERQDNASFTLNHYDRQDSLLPGVRLQGHTLRLGQDLGDTLRPRHPLVLHGGMAFFFGFPVPLGPVETGSIGTLHAEILPADFFQSFAWRTVVDRAGRVGEDPALGVTTTARLHVPAVPRDGDPQWRHDLAGVDLTARWTEWYVHDVAYPVQVDGESTVKNEGQREITRGSTRLVDLGQGSGPAVDWSRPSAPTPIDREPGATTLAPGAGPEAAYPLAQALADVEAAQHLVNYDLWRAANPDAQLAAASLDPDAYRPAETQAWVWRLTFATPAGDGWAITTQRVAGVPAARVSDGGAANLPRFDPAALGPAPLTLTGAVQAWRWSVSPEYRDQAPNLVRWGLADEGAGAPFGCLSPSVYVSHENPEDVRPSALLAVGWTTGTDCTDAGTQWREAVHAIDVDTGKPLWSYAVHSRFAPLLPSLPVDDAEESYVQQTATHDPVAARVEVFAWAASSLLAVVLLAYFLPLLKYAGAHALLLVPGYSRVAKDALLDQKIRDQMAEQIRNDPGVTATELKSALGIGWGTTVHHLRMLERHRLVSSLVDGRHRRFFPTGTMDWSHRARLAALKNDGTRRAFERIVTEPGVATTPLARHLGVTTAAAMWHLRRLEEAGLVGHQKLGRTVHYFPLEAARSVLEPRGDAFEVA